MNEVVKYFTFENEVYFIQKLFGAFTSSSSFRSSDSDQKSMIDLFRLIGRKTIDYFFDHGISIIDFRSLNFGMIK